MNIQINGLNSINQIQADQINVSFIKESVIPKLLADLESCDF